MHRLLTLGLYFFCGTVIVACADVAPPNAPNESMPPPTFITYGTPTGVSQFASVGTIYADFNGDGIAQLGEGLCTGSLVGPQVFLTAAHCVSWLPDGFPVLVSFDHDLRDGVTGAIPAESWTIHPLSSVPPVEKDDYAVALLPAGSTAGLIPYEIPPIGILEDMGERNGLKEAVFVNVGYGASSEFQGGPPVLTYQAHRRVSRSPFKALQNHWLGLHMNHSATDLGGDCYGDSGSPKFLEGYSNPNTVFAIVTWGDAMCRAVSWSNRLDTESAHTFLGEFVDLPG